MLLRPHLGQPRLRYRRAFPLSRRLVSFSAVSLRLAPRLGLPFAAGLILDALIMRVARPVPIRLGVIPQSFVRFR